MNAAAARQFKETGAVQVDINTVNETQKQLESVVSSLRGDEKSVNEVLLKFNQEFIDASVSLRDQALAAALPAMHLDLATPAYKLTLDILTAQREQFALLQSEWGHWTITHPTHPTVTFDHPRATQKYIEIAQRLTALSTQQVAATWHMLDAKSGG